MMNSRHGSSERDGSSSTERSSPVMLSPSLRSRVNSAKHLRAHRERPFAALRVTVCDNSTCQGLCCTIGPCLNEQNRNCHAERSEASPCPSRETFRGVYPERSEGLRVTILSRSCLLKFIIEGPPLAWQESLGGSQPGSFHIRR